MFDEQRIEAALALSVQRGHLPLRAPKPWGGGDAWWLHQYQENAQLEHVGLVDMNRFRPLSPGAHGLRVAWLQRALHMPEASQVFDPETEAAVRVFQTRNGLAADAIVGLDTFAALSRSAA